MMAYSLGEEILDAAFLCVSSSVFFQSPHHVRIVKVGAISGLWWQILRSLGQSSIVSLESDSILWNDLLV